MSEKTFKLHKLVRDGIVPDTEAQGGKAKYRELDGEEKIKALFTKIGEELNEFDASRDPSELSQAYGVFVALAKECGLNITDLVTMESKRQAEVGGFEQGIFIETITVPAESQWVKYYESNPDRYPEV